MKMNINIRVLVCSMALAAILLCTSKAAAQSQFVITDGSHKWLDRVGSTWTEDNRAVMNGTLAEFHKLVPSPEETRLVNRKGSHYVALDTASNNLSITPSTVLTPFCVWQRTGNTGYYYQEHVDNVSGKTYRYYLIASKAAGVSINRIEVGEDLNNITKWYDWDFGMAITEIETANGWTSSKYYWLMLNRAGQWAMSVNSYERPETIIYDNAEGTVYHYYDNFDDGGVNRPSGQGALFMPITTEYTAKTVSLPAGKGLTSVSASESNVPYLGNTVLTPTITFSDGGDPATVVEGYYTYVEEIERTHINTDYTVRTSDVAGSAGVPTTQTKYFWDSNPTTAQDNIPGETSETMRASDLAYVEYIFPNKVMRYIDTTRAGTWTAGIASSNVLTVRCKLLPRADMPVTVQAIDHYTNGAVGTPRTVSFTLKSGITHTPITQVNAPLIGGSVFGGGRMADVGGNTAVTVHNTDSIGAVFGGNDITGTVTGGSTVTIGSANTTTGVYVASVYGGGNGYYKYHDIATVDASHSTFSGHVYSFGDESESGSTVVDIDFGSGTKIPSIGTTTVVMNNDLARVDSLFGGAKNAFITGAGTGAVTVNQNAGTVFAEFGGNNYGGALTGAGAVIDININGTKEYTTAVVDNGHNSGFGYDFGIRYLFGGGNRVNAISVDMNIAGGMIDTCFAGGNSATVTTSSICHVETATDKKIWVNPKGELTNTEWVGGKGIYNVRNLFAGNNLADMNIIPTMELVKGGLGTVYGGGNRGDMTYNAALNTTLFPVDIDPLTDSILAPTKISTYVIVDAANTSDLDIDYLYGGCRMSNVTTSTYVKVNNGNVGTVFGGCNISGDVGTTTAYDYTDPTHANVFGTYVVISGDANIRSNVFAGANGNYHCNVNKTNNVNSFAYTDAVQFGDNDGDPFDPYDDYVDLYIPTHNNTNLVIKGGTVWGNVYGGANLANVGYNNNKYIRNDAQADCPEKHGSVHLTMNSGIVKGNMYGGGNMASIYGLSYLVVQGTSIIEGSLYAGNDRVGSVESFGAYIARTGITNGDFKASDGTPLNELSGSWNAVYSTYVLLKGTPAISKVYGSGNGAYNYDGTRDWYPDIQLCEGGANNRPIQSSSFIDINTSGLNTAVVSGNNKVDTVFGGGNGVSVNQNVTVLMNCLNTNDYYVGTIFGGNNRDDMNNCVPIIRLEEGKVGSVYGGGNAGNMNCMTYSAYDICGNEIPEVSTYIMVNSASAAIDTIYGGCNVADVKGMAYIDIRNTSNDGIGWVYGGNNVSGSVNGNTRIDVNGGVVNHIYGGSNGYYDYHEVAGQGFEVYKFGHNNDANYLIATGTTGVPNVATTYVNIYGGTINSNVYGGGRMGDCDSTHVVVNDMHLVDNCGGAPQSATINGEVYGGGEGIYWNLDATRRGNVNSLTRVDLYHASALTGAKSYGGGRGGNIYGNTFLTVHDQWEIPFSEIYGGCWGSDIYGTAHLSLHGSNDPGDTVARRVFGGNDFTGYVTSCELDIWSGNYGKVYGAGNGDSLYVYDTGAYNIYPLHVPNTETVVLNFHGGNVKDNIYGGGCLGTTMKHKVDGSGNYLLENNRRIPDTTYGYNIDAYGNYEVDDSNRAVRHPEWAKANATDYSYIIVNFHDGTADNIYAGGEGNNTLNVYGLKILNMDGGLVYESVYGGSERVDDGYKSECDSTGYYHRKEGPHVFTNTTLRPSSIVNIVGGTVTTSVYGGGYLGDAYGSTYVNIGMTAVDSCPVWYYTIHGTDSAYKKFRPGVDGGFSPTLTPSDLYLELSVYGGANWGSNVGSSFFTKPGIFGGETRVAVDGLGYNTGFTTSSLPKMNIKESIIGTGTSALAGDVLTRIDINNYGEIGNTCESSKTIKSVQRADELWLHNTAINYDGTTDAVSAYPSQNFTINRVDTVNAAGYNVINIHSLITNIEELNFFYDSYYSYKRLRRPQMSDYVTHQQLFYDDAAQCTSPTLCTQLAAIDRTTRKYTALLIQNGVNVDIMNENSGYGPINGFAYLMAEDGTNAMVTARSKSPYPPEGEDGHLDDGGFMSTCKTANHLPSVTTQGWQIVWNSEADDANRREHSEYVYNNYSSTYRVWSLGEGRRSRYTVILAHTNYTKLDEDKPLPLTTSEIASLTGNTTDQNLAIARATMTLPSTSPGHYYKMSQTEGIIVTEQNSKMKLADECWIPDNWDALPSTYTSGTYVDNLGAPITPSSGGVLNTQNVVGDAGYTFGLAMKCGEYFGNTVNSHAEGASQVGNTLISGNKNVSIISDYVSYAVGDDNNTSPVMDFYMTYNPDFSNTILGTVRFTLDEYDENGLDLHNPINVVVTIATIIDSFKDMEYEVLAMYNEGRTNYFTRKAVFPATLQHRDLYLKSVKWEPTDGNGVPITSGSTAYGSDPDKFYLTGSEETVVNTATPNTFCLAIKPVNNVTSDLTSNVGWHTITQKTMLDLHNTVYTSDQTGKHKISAGTLSAVDSVNLATGESKGIKIGELDGRGLAALNIQLTFDGDKIYPKQPGTKEYVGRAVLTLESFGPTQSEGEFKLTVYVKCREHGDTIYLASADAITRDGITLTWDPNHLTDQNAGKEPELYVQTFEQALSDAIYQEGDVIAIMDEVRIGANGEDFTIQGSDYCRIPVIRYSGDHEQFPGEVCAYRGTMINVTPAPDKTTSFTARCIDFIGSSVSKKKYDDGGVLKKSCDTLVANGPIIAVHGEGAVLNLQNGVTIQENFNQYVGSDSKLRGAVSVTDNGKLNFINNVEIFNNVSKYNVVDSHRDNGVVYVDNGEVTLQESHAESAVIINDNYLIPMTGAGADIVYWSEVRKNGDLIRYAFDNTNILNYGTTNSESMRANVFLTREGTTDLSDTQTDVINFTSRLPNNTLIGVTKWLPGPTTRDTICITNQASGNFTYSDMAAANNFVADEDKYTIFYNDAVNDNHIYLHQCATFRHQLAGNTLRDGSDEGSALEYVPLDGATCPVGGDKLYYRVTGGLFPYTYTWSGSQSRTRTTENNVKINEQIDTGNYAGYIDAVYDSLLTTSVSIPHNVASKVMTYNVTASDIAGCTLSKNAIITLEKVNGTPVAFTKTGTTENWTNNTSSVDAEGRREYKAIQITPRVWADRNLGTVAATIGNGGVILNNEEEISALYFCEGDVITLYTEPKNGNRFIMWDFDPYYEQQTRYVVPAASTTVTAYYGPNEYWINHITSTALAGAVYDANYTYTDRPTVAGYISTDGSNKAGMVTTYNGDLHIYDENGLAWFISCVNGYNNTQARTFHYNRVYIHRKANDEPYDMKAYLWTPMGTLQHPFEGMLLGVGKDEASSVDLTPWSSISGSDTTWDEVIIKNIIVDEPNLDYAGFFAVLDSARIINIEMQGALIRGAQYVGTMAAQSSNSRIRNVNIKSSEEDSSFYSSLPPTTLLSTHYVSGGMIGISTKDTVFKSNIAAKFVGDAVYSGGGVGHGTSTVIQEVTGYNDSRLRGLYTGGLAGYLNGNAPVQRLFRPKGANEPSIVQNNYFYVTTDGNNRRMGGVAGYAENSIIANNYVYGDIYASEATGGVVAVANNGTNAEYNYYENKAANNAAGLVTGNAEVSNYSNFQGQGNHVTLAQNIYGVNNLTRVLNRWVREQNADGSNFSTWRSDLEGVNNGYPIFGKPDTIPVQNTIDVEGCEEVIWDDLVYNADATLTTNDFDPIELVDSTTTINIVVHHGTHTVLSDTATIGEEYEGYGFTVTATESMLLNETLHLRGSAELVLNDTLQTVFGCDSIVTLTLIFKGGLDIPEVEVVRESTIKVYPNPTSHEVNIEAENMSHVELYDNEGRRLADYDTHSNDKIRINVSHLASGIYYLRVHTPQAVTIQKIVKR